MKLQVWLGLCLLVLFSVVAASENGKNDRKIEGNGRNAEKKQKKNTENELKKNSRNEKSKRRVANTAQLKTGKNKVKVKSIACDSSRDNKLLSSNDEQEWEPIEVPYHSSSSEIDLSTWDLSVHELTSLAPVITKCKNKGDLALTFDDGLSTVTLDVIEMLKRENVTATFFIIGQTLEQHRIGSHTPKEVLEMILRNGNEVASHSYSHPNFNDYWPEGIECEMNKTGGLFESLIGRKPRFMRPPFGNASDRTIKALHKLGYFIINWNTDTNDWMHKSVPEKAFEEFTVKVPTIAHIKLIELQKGPNQKAARLEALDSKIVLMHDILPDVVYYGPKIIAHARSLGYKFVSMSECLGGVNPFFLS